MSRQSDYAVPSNIVELLAATPFACTRAEQVSGGNANFVFRLHLCEPFNGHQTLILKHAKAYLASAKEIPLWLDRQNFEAEALRIVKQILPPDTLVTVPIVHHYDKEAHIIIMDDCGPNSRTLKRLFIEETFSPELARTVGAALGSFIATLHRRGSANRELMAMCVKNYKMQGLSAWATYGRLVDTIVGNDIGGEGPVVDPPLSLQQSDLDTIAEIAEETTRAIVAEKTAFTMGDFWTGNVIARTGRDESGALTVEQMFVVDWEVTKPGLQYLDVAQFLAELHLLRTFYPNRIDAVNETLRSLLSAYAEEIPTDETWLRGAAMHVGAHLVAWPPRAGLWGPRERVRQVVVEGVDYLLKGKRGNLEWLRTSAVNGLLSDRNVE